MKIVLFVAACCAAGVLLSWSIDLHLLAVDNKNYRKLAFPLSIFATIVACAILIKAH